MKQLSLSLLATRCLSVVLLTVSLSSCVFVAGAAAGAAAVAVVHDHRTIQKSIEDTKLAARIIDKINSIPELMNNSHVEVTAFNRIVLLTGQTPNAHLRKQAELFAETTPGASHVYNQITIEDVTSALTRTSDTWITTKIKSQILITKELQSSSIKVITENSSVYLMGIVTHAQADIAVDIARQVSGVQRVVKIFQYKD